MPNYTELSKAKPRDSRADLAMWRLFFTRRPKYFANDFMQRVDHKTTLTYRDSWPSFFLGKGDTVANLHVDMFGTANSTFYYY